MQQTPGRLQSLDALRGFDMFFIMGLAALITSICNLFPGGGDCWLATQMSHVEWDGLRHHDTIFPLFLFLAGVSFPFSHAKHLDSGATTCQVYRKIIKRGLTLVLFGLIYSGLLRFDFANLRLFSVLSRIGLAWMFAALIFINTKPKTRAIISAVILIGYWLLLLIPAPDAPGYSSLSFEGNIVGYIDRTLFGTSHLYQGIFDPEGLLSTLPAIVTALLGMFAGEFVRKPEISGNKKALYMLGFAAVLLVVGLLWSTVFPINKKLWSSTFVLVVGAYSYAMFAIFYWLIDVKGYRNWIYPFVVVGMNSITIYMVKTIVGFGHANEFFFGGLAKLCSEPWADVILNAGYTLVCWLFLAFLHKHKIFLKV